MHLRVGGPYYYGLRADSDVGGERYERLLLERLPAHGIELLLGLPRDSPFRPPSRAGTGGGGAVPDGTQIEGGGHAVPDGWRIETLRHDASLHWTRAPLVFVPYVYRLLRAGRVDLLRGHSVRHTGPSLLIGRALAEAAGGRVGVGSGAAERVPIVLHHHHLYPRWAKLEARIAAQADAVVTVSEHSRRELVAAGVPASRIHVIHQGIPRPPRTSGAPGLWPADGLRLLYVGRLEARKRPGVALEALAALGARGVPASLLVAGEGPLGGALRARAVELGVAPRVGFLGRVSDERKWALYDSAEALVFASTLEGFGLVVAEAQSRGVPVVAAAGTATAEALDPGRSGFLVELDETPPASRYLVELDETPAASRYLVEVEETPDGTSFAGPGPGPGPGRGADAGAGDAFAAPLARLAADPELRAAMSAHAAEFAARFDPDRAAGAVADLYRSLADPLC